MVSRKKFIGLFIGLILLTFSVCFFDRDIKADPLSSGSVRNSRPVALATPPPPPTAVPDLITRSDDYQSEFINNIYMCTMDREPDKEGFDYWFNMLYGFEITGEQAVKAFECTPEFEAKGYDDSELLIRIYKIFFDREPDQAGKEYWLNKLDEGMSVSQLISGFADSQEWADKSLYYGIISGSATDSQKNITPGQALLDLVDYMYSAAYNRTPDEHNRLYWAYRLSSFRITGEEFGRFFFLSPEMKSHNYNDEEFIKRVYLGFIGREADSDGLTYWTGVLEAGTSRTDVVSIFAHCPEYIEKCIASGIIPYRKY